MPLVLKNIRRKLNIRGCCLRILVTMSLLGVLCLNGCRKSGSYNEKEGLDKKSLAGGAFLCNWHETRDAKSGNRVIGLLLASKDITPYLNSDIDPAGLGTIEWMYSFRLNGEGNVFKKEDITVLNLDGRELLSVLGGNIVLDLENGNVIIELSLLIRGKDTVFIGNGSYPMSTGPRHIRR